MTTESGSFQILVVDVDASVSRVAAIGIPSALITTATSASAGLQHALQTRYDAVVWDIDIDPDFTNFLLVRSICPQAHIICTTSAYSPLPQLLKERLGIRQILRKPYQIENLILLLVRSLQQSNHTWQAISDIFCVGQPLRVWVQDQCGYTRIMLRDQNVFHITGHPRGDMPLNIAVGTVIQAETAASYGVYRFRSKVIREILEPASGLEMKMPSSVQLVQRRKHRRSNLRLHTVLQSEASGRWESQLLNLSVSGCAIVSKPVLEKGAAVLVEFTGARAHWSGKGYVKRIEEVTGSLEKIYGIKFTGRSSNSTGLYQLLDE